jgi:hypothetical protein
VDGKISIWLKKLVAKSFNSFKRDVVVFAFFLFLSFIFWYLNSLKKDIEIDIRYPVRYVNPPKDRIIANEVPEKLTFNIKGPGYSIIKLKLSGNRVPVVIDFTKVTYKRLPETARLEYYIISSGLIPSFKKQLNSDFQIVSIKPDTLFIVFEKKANTHPPGKGSTGPLKSTMDMVSQRLLSSASEFITEKRQK